MPSIAVIDTNIWVSAFITPHLHAARLIPLWRAGRFDVVVSTPLLEEIDSVLSRPRLMNRYHYPAEDMFVYLRSIMDLAVLVPVTGTLEMCRDPKDNFLLETAIVGKATHVVSRDEDITRDTDLFAQLKQRGIEPITVARFLRALEAG